MAAGRQAVRTFSKSSSLNKFGTSPFRKLKYQTILYLLQQIMNIYLNLEYYLYPLKIPLLLFDYQ
jgi:hypothetical protein